MSSKSTRLTTLWVVIIMGLMAPCVCGLASYALETGALTNLPSRIDRLTWGFLLVASVGLLPDVLASITLLKNPALGQPYYSALMQSLVRFIRYASVILLISYLLVNQHSGLSAVVGQPTTADLLNSSAIGVLVLSAFAVIYGLGYELVHKRKQVMDPADLAFQMLSIQRTIVERIVFLPILFLGVIAEELLYRGYLILVLGNEAGPMLLWASLSVLLSVVVHLYQGRSRIVWHLLFAALATSTTILTGNIVMSTAMHLYLNLISTLKVWSMVDKTSSTEEDLDVPPAPS